MGRGRHASEDDPRTLPLGKLVAAGHGVHGDPEPDWEDAPPRRWPLVAGALGAVTAGVLGWMLADLGGSPAPTSSPRRVVETVTVTPAPVPTVTRWRTREPSRPPAAGKVVTLTPSPAPTVTRWRTRTMTPAPAPTVTVFRTRTLAPPDVGGSVEPDLGMEKPPTP